MLIMEEVLCVLDSTTTINHQAMKHTICIYLRNLAPRKHLGVWIKIPAFPNHLQYFLIFKNSFSETITVRSVVQVVLNFRERFL